MASHEPLGERSGAATVITGARLFDGTRLIPGSSVVISGGVIASAGPGAGLAGSP